MGRAFCLCHMMCSLDGKTTGRFFEDPSCAKSGEFYDRMTLAFSKGWCCGRATFQYLSSDKPLDSKYAKIAVPEGDFILKDDTHPYCFAIDRKGKLLWESPYNDYTPNPSRVVEVVTAMAPKAYLAFLREKKIPYFFAGQTEFDPEIFLEKVKSLYGLSTLVLCGGGHINGVFFARDLIDEISLVVAAVVDGQEAGLSFAEMEKPIPQSFALVEIKKLEDDGIWLHYKRKR